MEILKQNLNFLKNKNQKSASKKKKNKHLKPLLSELNPGCFFPKIWDYRGWKTPWGDEIQAVVPPQEDPELAWGGSAAPRDLLAAGPGLIECGAKKTSREK